MRLKRRLFGTSSSGTRQLSYVPPSAVVQSDSILNAVVGIDIALSEGFPDIQLYVSHHHIDNEGVAVLEKLAAACNRAFGTEISVFDVRPPHDRPSRAHRTARHISRSTRPNTRPRLLILRHKDWRISSAAHMLIRQLRPGRIVLIPDGLVNLYDSVAPNWINAGPANINHMRQRRFGLALSLGRRSLQRSISFYSIISLTDCRAIWSELLNEYQGELSDLSLPRVRAIILEPAADNAAHAQTGTLAAFYSVLCEIISSNGTISKDEVVVKPHPKRAYRLEGDAAMRKEFTVAPASIPVEVLALGASRLTEVYGAPSTSMLTLDNLFDVNITVLHSSHDKPGLPQLLKSRVKSCTSHPY